MKNKILTIFILGIFLISFISFTSAWTSVDFTLDQSKQIEMKDSITSYGKYEIKDYAWYDILKIWTEEKIKEVVLEENTPECSDNCFAIKEVTNLKPMPLIEDVRFFREIDGKWVSWNSFTNWRIEVEEDVDLFETQCIQGKEIFIEENKTSYFEQDCSQIKIGTEKQWKPLDYKKDYEGTYRVKLSGGKKPDVKYDWQVKIGGEWTDKWAVWGNISEGDDAEVILNSPDDEEVMLTNLVTLNATGNVTGGAHLVNVTLYDNSTGSWGARNTSNMSSVIIFDNFSTNTAGNYTCLAWDSGCASGSVSGGEFISGTGGYNTRTYYYTQTIDLTKNQIIEGRFKSTGTNWGAIGLVVGADWTSGSQDAVAFHIKEDGGDATVLQKYVAGSATTFNTTAGSYATNTYYNLKLVYFANNQSWYGYEGGVLKANAIITDTSIYSSTAKVGFIFRAYISGYNQMADDFNVTTTTTTTTTTFTNTYPAGSVINWSIQYCDSDGDCYYPPAYLFSVDGTAPQITMNYPTSLIDYGKLNNSLQLNFTATDTNLDKVWYDYNGTNVTIAGATSGVYNLSNITLSTKKNVTIYANDTAGNLNVTTFSWDYKVFENDRIYSLNAYETEMKDFIINLTYNSSTFVPTVYLNYDGTNYSTINIGSGNEGKFKNTISIGLIDGSTSKEFYWWILANDSVIKTESNNQTINNLIFQICNGTYTNKTLNFKFYDESKNTLLNSTLNPLTFETYFEFWVGNGDIKKSYNYNVQNTTTGSYDFCISPANFSFNSNLQISYSAEGYSKRESSYNELNLTNIIQNISFYLLPTELSTKFTHYVRQEIEALAGVSVEVYKFLISTGNYTLISTKTTDENGRFVEWLEVDQKYKYIVKSEGISLTEQEKQAICAVSPCEITLQIDEVSLNAFNELNAYFAQNVDYNLTYNKSTSTFKLSFLDLTGTANYWRLYVYKSNSNNDTLNSICNLYAYSSSGELECDTSLYFGEITAKVYISRSPEKLVDFLIRVNENITPVLSVSGLLASIIILLVIIFTGTRNPTSALLMLPFGLIILKFIGFMPLTWGWIVGITIFILAISYKMNT